MKAKSIGLALAIILPCSYVSAQWVQTSGLSYGALALYVDGEKLFAGTTLHGVFLSTSGGATWKNAGGGVLDFKTVDAFAVSDSKLFAGTGDDFLYYTTNDGVTWNRAIGSPSPAYALAASGTNVFAGTGSGGVWLSTDSGRNWYIASTGLPRTNNVFANIFALAVDGGNLFAGTNGYGVFLSTNNGGIWRPANTGLEGTLVFTFAFIGNNLFAGTSDGAFLSTNNGTSWTAANTGLTNTTVYALAVSGTNLFAGTYGGGVFLSTNNGTSWTVVNTGLADKNILTLAATGTHLVAGTQSSGVWRRPLSEFIEATHPPLILIPGIMGSPLFYDSNGNGVLETDIRNEFPYTEHVWIFNKFLDKKPWPALHLNSLGQSEYPIVAPPIASDPSMNLEKLKQLLPLSCYEAFLDSMVRAGYRLDNNDGVVEAEDLFVFTYDWRLDIRTNADLLNDFVSWVRTQTGSNEVDIVAHSMGGLVAKSYIQRYSATNSHIRRLIFVATPHLGSPETYASIANGYRLPVFSPFYWILTDAEIQQLSENMPGAYQLSPSRGYFGVYPAPIQVNGNGLNFDATIQYLKDNEFSPYSHVLNRTLIDDINNFQSALNLLDFGNIQIFNIVGAGLPTIGELVPRSTFDGQKFQNRLNLYGDGTVPLGSAETISGHATVANYYIVGKYNKHQDLPSGLPVIEIIRGLLREPIKTSGWLNSDYITTTPDNSNSITLTYQVTAGSPVVLHAYDNFGRHTGSTSDTTYEEEIPGSTYIPGNLSDYHSAKTIMLPDSTSYRIVVKAQDTTGTFDLMLVDYVDGATTRQASFTSVPIVPGSVAVCSLRTVANSTTLLLDRDGDGRTDTTIVPSQYVVAGVEAPTKEDALPTGFYLGLAYPNPFNPTTTIKYELPKFSEVRLAVYDILGREVSVLVNERRDAGVHEVKFDASKLASGVYLYRMQAGSYVETRKLLLVR